MIQFENKYNSILEKRQNTEAKSHEEEQENLMFDILSKGMKKLV